MVLNIRTGITQQFLNLDRLQTMLEVLLHVLMSHDRCYSDHLIEHEHNASQNHHADGNLFSNNKLNHSGRMIIETCCLLLVSGTRDEKEETVT
jgi:hypothetical protein